MRPPRSRDDLIVSPRPNGDGVLVYDPTTDTGHVLEGITASVFAACDGSSDHDALALHVVADTGAPVDRTAIDAALVELTEAGLLADARGVSRRLLMGGLVAGAAAAAVAPMIVSVVRPKRAGAQVLIECDDKSATTPVDTAVGVTASSTGTDPDFSVYWVVTPPTNGTVVVTNHSSGGVNTGATMTYTPNPGYIGPDSFTYIVGECAPAVGGGYTAPQYARDACPTSTTITTGYGNLGTVTITVTPAPTTTTAAPEPTTPKYTG